MSKKQYGLPLSSGLEILKRRFYVVIVFEQKKQKNQQTVVVASFKERLGYSWS